MNLGQQSKLTQFLLRVRKKDDYLKRSRKVKLVAAAKQPVLMPIMALVEFWLGKREASRRAFVWPRPGTAALCGQLLPAADKHRVQPLEHCSLITPPPPTAWTSPISFSTREKRLLWLGITTLTARMPHANCTNFARSSDRPRPKAANTQPSHL